MTNFIFSKQPSLGRENFSLRNMKYPWEPHLQNRGGRGVMSFVDVYQINCVTNVMFDSFLDVYKINCVTNVNQIAEFLK